MMVFLSLAAVGLLILLFSALVGDHFDSDADVDHGAGGFLSVRAVAVFVTAFGTVGAIARWYQQPATWASGWGLLAGLAMSVVYVLTMGLVKSQEASSLIEDCELAGVVGRVTVALTPAGLGEVSCTVKAQTTRRLARATPPQAVPEGTLVRVVEVQGDVMLVEPMVGTSAAGAAGRES